MAKHAPSFICQNCGAAYGRWPASAKPAASGTRSPEEGAAADRAGPGRSARKGRVFALEPLAARRMTRPRLPSACPSSTASPAAAFVRGSVLLMAGDPGIGKSTLLIQAGGGARQDRPPRGLYLGRRAVAQVRLRAGAARPRQGAGRACGGDLGRGHHRDDERGQAPRLIVIDSIQTMWTDAVESAPGTVTQVRGSAQALIRFAKRSGAAIILVGHVTKDGQIAGPARGRAHGRRGALVRGRRRAPVPHPARGEEPLRPDRRDRRVRDDRRGLREVPNPSELFLSERDLGSPGTVVFAGIEGTRPLLVEIQALVAPTSLGTPRRSVVGWDSSRLSMVLAVLEAHCGVKLGGYDVYLNVAGGLRIQEPAADLAAAAALVSSLAGASLPAEAVYFGEVSLSGAVRPVAQSAARMKEAAKLGFTRAFAPDAREAGTDAALAITAIGNLADLVADIAASGKRARGPVRLARQDG
jgi:DNA repair protein RadA/Sms